MNPLLKQALFKAASMEKQANPALVAALRHTKAIPGMLGKGWEYGTKALGIGAGALATPAVVEFGGKTLNNAVHGKPELGNADWTGTQYGKLMNLAINATPVGPGIAQGVKQVATETLGNPDVKQLLNATELVTNPANRQQSINMLTDAAASMAERGGKSLGYGAASGMGQALLDKPGPVLAGSLALGTAPLVAYDLSTRNRREKEENDRRAILSYIRGQQKTAAIKLPASLGKFIGKYVYRPTEVPASVFTSAANPQGNISLSAINNTTAKHLPQTALNNSLSRNWFKTLVGGTAAIGGMAGANKAIQDPQTISSGKLVGDTLSGMVGGPAKVLKAVEGGVLAENPAYKELNETPGMQQLSRIKDNLSGKSTGVVTKPPITDLASNPFSSTDTSAGNGSTSWDKTKPFLAAGGALLAPYGLYEIYRRTHERELQKKEQRNAQLTSQILTDQ